MSSIERSIKCVRMSGICVCERARRSSNGPKRLATPRTQCHGVSTNTTDGGGEARLGSAAQAKGMAFRPCNVVLVHVGIS